MSAHSPAPIAFFAFNRPDHTRQTLEALARNPLAAQSHITIFCDGARATETAEGLERIAEVRRVVAAQKWCGKVEIVVRERNFGLLRSLSEGITDIVERHGRVIVLEDDVVPTEGFLQYLNDALDLYADDEQVMHISAYLPDCRIPTDLAQTTFFYNHTNCWGWATWKRAWRHFSRDGAAMRRAIRQSGRKRYINMDNSYEFYGGLKYIDLGRFQDWNYYWHTAVNLQNGLCLHPVQSLTSNIGFDGSGTHCTTDGAGGYTRADLAQSLPVARIALVENREIRQQLTARPWHRRALFVIKGMLREARFALQPSLR